jgi:hypothetical protein
MNRIAGQVVLERRSNLRLDLGELILVGHVDRAGGVDEAHVVARLTGTGIRTTRLATHIQADV